jgi:hypothetical protein
MELEVSPVSIGVGEPYTVKIYVTPTNDKPWKLRSIAVATRRDAKPGPSLPATLLATMVSRGERTLIAEVAGTWDAVLSSWVLEAKVTTDRGDTISNKIALRK